MNVFNQQVKQLQHDHAAADPESQDYNYLRKEIAARLADRLNVRLSSPSSSLPLAQQPTELVGGTTGRVGEGVPVGAGLGRGCGRCGRAPAGDPRRQEDCTARLLAYAHLSRTHARTPPAALDHSLLCSTIQRSVLLETSTWTPILRVRCLSCALACLGSDVTCLVVCVVSCVA